MATFALTDAGLSTPRYPEARALVVEKWKSRFGDDAQTSDDTPDGLLISTIALMLALAWEGVAATYVGSYFRTAAGASLDLLLDLFGARRLAATYSTLSAVWYGDAGVTVLAERIASVGGDAEQRFETDEDATTVADGVGGPIVVRILDAVDGETYAIDVDTTTESTVVAGASSTTTTIADALATQLATDNPTATVSRAGSDPDGNALIVLEDLDAGVVTVGGSADTPANQDVRNGVRVDMTALTTGPIVALAGTLDSVETPVANIDGVCTTADATVGRNRESDEGFRDRHLDRLNSGGKASLEAIYAYLLDTVADLEHVRVFANTTGATDSDGRPPHSVEVVWIGPAGSTKEQEVAEAIFDVLAFGIRPYGAIENTVTDSYGGVHTVGHSRGTELYLWLDVTVTPAEGYPTSGDPEGAILEEIATWLGDGGEGELGMGDDLIRYALGTPINAAVPGVGNVVITTATTTTPGGTPSYSAADVSVDDDTILRVDSSRIAVST